MLRPRMFTCMRLCKRVLLSVLIVVILIWLLSRHLSSTCSQSLAEPQLANKMEILHKRQAPLKYCYKDGQLLSLQNISVDSFPNGIPMMLHSTWKTQKLPDAKWDKMAKICKQQNKHFTFCHWDDEELEAFVAANYPSFLRHFLSYPYSIQRADAGRYLLLHTYGGFYKDTNIGCRVSFDAIVSNITSIHSMSSIKQQYSNDSINNHSSHHTSHFKVLLFEVQPAGIGADFIATTPQHPFFTFLVQNLKSRPVRYGLPYLDVMLGTGPLFLGQMYWRFLANESIPNSLKNELTLIPPHLFFNTYFYFYIGGTWHCADGRVIWWVFDNRRFIFKYLSVLLFIFSIISCYCICSRTLRLNRAFVSKTSTSYS